MARAQRELRSVQGEEDRAIRLFVSGKITESQLDLQRKFITERLESLRAKLDDYEASAADEAGKQLLTEQILVWAWRLSDGIDGLSSEERQETLRAVVDEIVIDRGNKVSITLAIPVGEPAAEKSVAIASHPS